MGGSYRVGMRLVWPGNEANAYVPLFRVSPAAHVSDTLFTYVQEEMMNTDPGVC